MNNNGIFEEQKFCNRDYPQKVLLQSFENEIQFSSKMRNNDVFRWQSVRFFCIKNTSKRSKFKFLLLLLLLGPSASLIISFDRSLDRLRAAHKRRDD